MTTTLSSQEFESYVPVYDAIPEKWEDAQPFLVEQLKKISNGVNAREIGFYLDEELLSGKAFIPGETAPGNNPGIFRSVLRKVIVFGPIVAGPNQRPHDIVFDANFTLIDLWATATNSATLNATIFCNSDTITIDATNINLISSIAADRCFAFVEYVQEQ